MLGSSKGWFNKQQVQVSRCYDDFNLPDGSEPAAARWTQIYGNDALIYSENLVFNATGGSVGVFSADTFVGAPMQHTFVVNDLLTNVNSNYNFQVYVVNTANNKESGFRFRGASGFIEAIPVFEGVWSPSSAVYEPTEDDKIELIFTAANTLKVQYRTSDEIVRFSKTASIGGSVFKLKLESFNNASNNNISSIKTYTLTGGPC